MTVHYLPGAPAARLHDYLHPLAEVVEHAETYLSKRYMTEKDSDAVIYLRRAWARRHKNIALEGLPEFENLRRRLFADTATLRVPLECTPMTAEPRWIAAL